ncbi:MAG: hypothetical protein KAI73_02135 [Rhodospirillaceae bacterium]|nr:hypothetical protein [Rhodospirillaceae bacterium]
MSAQTEDLKKMTDLVQGKNLDRPLHSWSYENLIRKKLFIDNADMQSPDEKRLITMVERELSFRRQEGAA